VYANVYADVTTPFLKIWNLKIWCLEIKAKSDELGSPMSLENLNQSFLSCHVLKSDISENSSLEVVDMVEGQ
jgi:hypothetical protein